MRSTRLSLVMPAFAHENVRAAVLGDDLCGKRCEAAESVTSSVMRSARPPASVIAATVSAAFSPQAAATPVRPACDVDAIARRCRAGHLSEAQLSMVQTRRGLERRGRQGVTTLATVASRRSGAPYYAITVPDRSQHTWVTPSDAAAHDLPAPGERICATVRPRLSAPVRFGVASTLATTGGFGSCTVSAPEAREPAVLRRTSSATTSGRAR